MDRVNPRCAGLDVHKDSVWACARVDGGKPFVEKFGTTSRELLRLGDWLASLGVTVVAMESTGVFWKPVWKAAGGPLRADAGQRPPRQAGAGA
jgi:transposase